MLMNLDTDSLKIQAFLVLFELLLGDTGPSCLPPLFWTAGY